MIQNTHPPLALNWAPDDQSEVLEKMIDELDERLAGSKSQAMVIDALKTALEMLKAGKATCEAGGT